MFNSINFSMKRFLTTEEFPAMYTHYVNGFLSLRKK